MPPANRPVEVADIDALLSDPKKLRGRPPEWTPTGWRSNYQATWIVEDSAGAARATLRFTCRKGLVMNPSIAMVFRERLVWLLEFEEPPLPQPHRNPPWAASLKLPAEIYGSHEHTWTDNRDHLLNYSTDWELPCRRSLNRKITKFPQALAAFAASVGIELESEQRLFDIPPQRELL